VSATPEQIADLCERLDEPSNWMKEGRANEDWNTLRGTYDKAPFEAAALIRAQGERVRVLEEALNIIAQWDSFSPPLTKNDANIPPEDFPHYVAGRAHAELALIRNYASKSIARAALKAAP
jgi:hypothetical protein